MKTPTAIKQQVSELGFSVINLVPDDGIAEIQRDAREGMVPLEDVAPLLEHLDSHADSGIECNLCHRKREAFRAKHPSLFTK